MKTMKRHQSQRGYNIVEMAIALAVLGLLLGGLLVPLQVRYEQENIADAREQLALAKEAVYGYALRHETTALYYQEERDGDTHFIPAGRPYLPCPDITGNGLENRTGITLIAIRTGTKADGDADNPASEIAIDKLTNGTCEESKGMLPWRTLGLEPLDPWGTYLTYRVDLAYASQAFGFDETMRADILDPTQPTKIKSGTEVLEYEVRAQNDYPSVICGHFWDGNTSEDDCPDSNYANVYAGVFGTLITDARTIAEYDNTNSSGGLMDGAVFVILSHGENGWGGIRVAGGSSNKNRCRAAPKPFTLRNNGETSIGELANAYYADGHPFRVDPFNCVETAATTVHDLQENLFTSPIISEDGGNDDIVVWSGADELFGNLMKGGVLPLSQLEFLPR